MDRVRLAPAVGIIASLGFLVVLAVPFGSPGVESYYASGMLNPLIGGLLTLVTILVFAAGRQQRTDPALAAGIALALGLVTAIIAVVWAATARTDVLPIARFHRYALSLAGIAIPFVAAWYARELRIL